VVIEDYGWIIMKDMKNNIAHLYPYGLAHSLWQHAPAALSGSHEEASGVTWALKPTKKMSG